ncbi:hypothetical protein M3J09_001682 [Ascochyta lentis]
MLDMNKILSSALHPDLENRDKLEYNVSPDETTRSDRVYIQKLANEFGWMNCLRGNRVQWIHISSKYSGYLSACFVALSDWNKDLQKTAAALHQSGHYIDQQE